MRLGLIAVLMCAAAAGVGAQEQPVAQPPECAVGCPPPGSGMGQACYMRTPPALRPQRPEIIIGGPPTTPSGTPFIGGPTSPSATPSTPILGLRMSLRKSRLQPRQQHHRVSSAASGLVESRPSPPARREQSPWARLRRSSPEDRCRTYHPRLPTSLRPLLCRPRSHHRLCQEAEGACR